MALYKAVWFRAHHQSILGPARSNNSTLDNWINIVLLHILALRCLAFWEIKWRLYYTGTAVLLVCYTANRIQILLKRSRSLHKNYLASVPCDIFQDSGLKEWTWLSSSQLQNNPNRWRYSESDTRWTSVLRSFNLKNRDTFNSGIIVQAFVIYCFFRNIDKNCLLDILWWFEKNAVL